MVLLSLDGFSLEEASIPLDLYLDGSHDYGFFDLKVTDMLKTPNCKFYWVDSELRIDGGDESVAREIDRCAKFFYENICPTTKKDKNAQA